MKKLIIHVLAFLMAMGYTYAQEERFAVNYRYIAPEYSATFDGVDDCIRTGVTFGPDVSIEIKCQILSYGQYDKPFGSITSPYYGIGLHNSTQFYYSTNGVSLNTFADIDFSNPQTVYYNPNKGQARIREGGAKSFPRRTVVDTGEILIGGGSHYAQFVNMEFYYCKIWEQGRLIRYYLAQVDGTIKDILHDETYENYEKGTDLVTNGDFTNGMTGWTGTDWTVVDGQAKNAGGNDWLYQQGTLATDNQQYFISFDVQRTSSVGELRAYRGIGAQQVMANIPDGHTELIFNAGVASLSNDDFLGFKPNTGWVGTIDNVVIIPIGHTPFPVTRLAGVQTFYVATTADGGSNSNDGSSSSPFADIPYAISQSSAGTDILVKPGRYYANNEVITRAASSGARINVRAYNPNNPPIVTGFTKHTSFNTTGDKHVIENATTQADVQFVMYNDTVSIPARYPNTGYFRIDNADDTYLSFLSSDVWNYTPSDNARIEFKRDKYYMTRSKSPVTVSGHRVYAESYYGSGIPYRSLGGYFFANDSNAMDVDGEHYFNPVTKDLTIQSSTVPDSVNVATSNILFSFQYPSDFITFDNIIFEGFNQYAIELRRAKNITFENCEFRNGYTAWDIHNWGSGVDDSKNPTMRNCYVHNLVNMAVDALNEAYGGLYEDNLFENIALWPGLGGFKNGQYTVLRTNGAYSVVRRNTFKNCGYHAVSFGGAYTSVVNNHVKKACLVMDDGAGIYTGGGNIPGREILNNIIEYTYGNPDGMWYVVGSDTVLSDSKGHDIYLDEAANNVLVRGNSGISSMHQDSITDSFLKFHKGRNHIIEDNTSFYHLWGYSIEAYSQDIVENITFRNNLTVVKPNGLALFWTSWQDNLADLGTMTGEHVNHWVENGDSLYKTRFGPTKFLSQTTFDAQQGYTDNYESEYVSDTGFVVKVNPTNSALFYTAQDSVINLKTLQDYDSGEVVLIPPYGSVVMTPYVPIKTIVYGPELLLNTDFETTLDPWYNSGVSNWTLGTGVAEIDAYGDAGNLNHDNVFSASKDYLFKVDVVNSGTGALSIYRGQGNQLITQIATTGHYETSFSTDASVGVNTKLMIIASTGFVGNIDNISLKEVNPVIVEEPVDTNKYGPEKIINGNFATSDAWYNSGEVNWTIANEAATITTSTSSGNFLQDDIFTDTANWVIEFDLTRSAGAFALYRGLGHELIGSANATGHYKWYYTTPIITAVSDGIQLNAPTGFIGSIDNFSVKEVNPPNYTAPIDTNSYGPELLTNNTFTSDLSGWTQGGSSTWSWTVDGANINASSASGNLTQSNVFSDSLDYRVIINFTSSQGGISLFRGSGNDLIGSTNTSGYNEFTYSTDSIGATNGFMINAAAGFIGTVDSVSVMVINPVSSPPPPYDPGVILNGQFDADFTHWYTGGTSTWTWTDGQATINAASASGNLNQDNVFASSTTYTISFDIEKTAGSVSLYRGVGAELIGSFTTAGHHVIEYTTPGSIGTATRLMINGNSGFVGSVDNISVVPKYSANLITNGTFADGTGWSFTSTNWNISGGVAYVNNQYTDLSATSYTLEVGKTYLLEFDCTSASGARFLWIRNSSYRVANGTYSAIITPTISEYLILRSDGTPGGSDYIDNVSLKEIYY